MSNNLSYITLDSVITDFLNESEQSISKYAKIFHIAFRGMDTLGLDFFYRIQSVKLPINPNFTVTLPAGFINWTKVGILNNYGELIPIQENNNLVSYADLLPNRISKVEDPQSVFLTGQWNNTVWANYWNGSDYTNIYGVPAGEPFIGEFKIDIDNGVIILSPNFPRDYLILEYLSAPSENQEYRIPIQFREALIAWMYWKDGNAKSIKSNMQIANKRDWRHEFYNERRIAISRWKPIRLQEQMQTKLEMSRLAVKI